MRAVNAVLSAMDFHVTGISVTICGGYTMIQVQRGAVIVDLLPLPVGRCEAGINAKQGQVTPRSWRSH
jgi:hypothetical protein